MNRRLLVLAACGVALVGCSKPEESFGCTAAGGESGVVLTVEGASPHALATALGRSPSREGLLPVRAQVCLENQPCRTISTTLFGDSAAHASELASSGSPTDGPVSFDGILRVPTLKKGQTVAVSLLPAPTAGSSATPRPTSRKTRTARKTSTARPYQPNGAACDGDQWAHAQVTFTDRDLR